MTASPRLLKLLVGVAAIAVLPALLSDRLAAAWVAALGGLVLACALDVALAPSRRRLGLAATAPASLVLGEQGALVVSLESPAAVPVRAELLVDLDPRFQPQPTAFADVPARGSVTVTLSLVPRRRGTLRVDALWARWSGPLGLVRRRKRIALEQDVVVLPDLRPVRQAAMQFAFSRDFLIGARQVRRAGDGSEFESLREHLPGMDPRTIDWKASARHLRLRSRETRAERDRPVVIAVDTGRLMGEPVDGIPRVDHAIRAALLVGYAALKSGDRVGLFAFDDRPRVFVPPTSGTGAFARLVASTGALAYSTAETNFALAVAELGTRLTRRSLVIVLTDFVDSTTAELMLDGMSVLARRHVLLFAALRDTELFALADAEPTSVADLYRAVVASDLLRDREVALRRLQRAGALVVDAPVSRLSTDVLDRYLLAHRRELVG